MSAKLPIINKISYSALSDLEYCSFYYKLCNIDKLKQWDNTVWTHWGTLIHKYVQLVLEDKMDAKEAAKRFARTWKKFCGIFGEIEYEEGVKVKELAPLEYVGGMTVLTIKAEFLKKFGEFKVLDIERYIKAPNGSEWPQEFRGFVDIIIQVVETGEIIIIDFKSCKSGYFFNKFKDKFKDYQLTLYKHYLLKEEPSWEAGKTETYFVTLERNPTSKKPIGFSRVTSGNKKIQNAVDWLTSSLSVINRQKWIKNRTSCLKYGEKHPCMFYKTEHCP